MRASVCSSVGITPMTSDLKADSESSHYSIGTSSIPSVITSLMYVESLAINHVLSFTGGVLVLISEHL
jgi:hypothetical protein